MSLPLVCATLSGTTVEDMLADAARATAAGADVVEARLDMLYMQRVAVEAEQGRDDVKSKVKRTQTKLVEREAIDFEIDEVLSLLEAGIELPVILTCRPKRQGGYFPGNEQERCEILRKAIDSGVSWVDLEMDIDEGKRGELASLASGKTQVICSEHFDRQPDSNDEVVSRIREMSEFGDLVKLCYKTGGKRSGLSLFEAAWELKGEGLSYTVMGLGNAGDWTRIHAPILGIGMVYTTSESDPREASSGKINTTELITAWEMLDYS